MPDSSLVARKQDFLLPVLHRDEEGSRVSPCLSTAEQESLRAIDLFPPISASRRVPHRWLKPRHFTSEV